MLVLFQIWKRKLIGKWEKILLVEQELRNFVATEIGPIAKPDLIQNAPGLPKTRSGKIMRRILRKIAENDLSNLGDTTTLADPTVVESLINNKISLWKKLVFLFLFY